MILKKISRRGKGLQFVELFLHLLLVPLKILNLNARSNSLPIGGFERFTVILGFSNFLLKSSVYNTAQAHEPSRDYAETRHEQGLGDLNIDNRGALVRLR